MAARVTRSVRLLPERVEDLRSVAELRFAGNATAALDAALQIAAIVYASPAGRGAETPAEALERWAASRRAKG